MELIMEKVQKRYGKRHLFDIENLRLPSGGLYGLMGPNGAGKTTLLKMVAGLGRPDHGGFLYDGIPWHKGLFKDITYLSQKAYMMNATVKENIAWPLEVRGIGTKEREIRIQQALERMEIPELADRKATTLSGGEAQKVAFARALVFKPKLLLMDEPAASLDKQANALFESRMLQYHEETNATVIFITHSAEQAQRCCKELLWLEDGKIEAAPPHVPLQIMR
ncbi:ATP-binding cassette domain-containing protein [Acidaminobacter hydrogenoformans]|uniref:Carbohydrate ABC transporter ATP-binding protein, CUT1 family n=1 Tax=Acidaminobacter hydrogenoformans DSM 2784 TaxID=1120920 RepID=A0A1G5RYV3_9FIRM|nr:ATP-binding cassette domain-containing protein [Acidaminobacter hydrogenoformans]SCZ79282.1 carbohydrate ABC transporter ATP-binding protein, CUT1 family [Acidaminobacter hydrogenoformans DSM 2784]